MGVWRRDFACQPKKNTHQPARLNLPLSQRTAHGEQHESDSHLLRNLRGPHTYPGKSIVLSCDGNGNYYTIALTLLVRTNCVVIFIDRFPGINTEYTTMNSISQRVRVKNFVHNQVFQSPNNEGPVRGSVEPLGRSIYAGGVSGFRKSQRKHRFLWWSHLCYIKS